MLRPRVAAAPIRATLWLTGFVAVALAAACAPDPSAGGSLPRAAAAAAVTATDASITLPAPPASAEQLVVQRVVDGDTFVARFPTRREERVRLVGVDTPESVQPTTPVQCFAREAAGYTRTRLEGQRVLAAKDVSEADRFGRRLRLVWLEDGAFFNAELIARGYAQVATFPPDVTYADLFRALERRAREQGLGLWRSCR